MRREDERASRAGTEADLFGDAERLLSAGYCERWATGDLLECLEREVEEVSVTFRLCAR